MKNHFKHYDAILVLIFVTLLLLGMYLFTGCSGQSQYAENFCERSTADGRMQIVNAIAHDKTPEADGGFTDINKRYLLMMLFRGKGLTEKETNELIDKLLPKPQTQTKGGK